MGICEDEPELFFIQVRFKLKERDAKDDGKKKMSVLFWKLQIAADGRYFTFRIGINTIKLLQFLDHFYYLFLFLFDGLAKAIKAQSIIC